MNQSGKPDNSSDKRQGIKSFTGGDAPDIKLNRS